MTYNMKAETRNDIDEAIEALRHALIRLGEEGNLNDQATARAFGHVECALTTVETVRSHLNTIPSKG